MSTNRHIEWTDATWNPVTGCTKVSEGCENCYAERISRRLKAMGNAKYRNGFEVTLRPECLNEPLYWREGRRIFVCSMSDLFHEDVPIEFIFAVFDAALIVPQHIYQFLTKRSRRMLEVTRAYCAQRGLDRLPSTWWGLVTVENQRVADERVLDLLEAPWAIRGVCASPLLEKIDLEDVNCVSTLSPDWAGGVGGGTGHPHPLLDCVFLGGESDPHARPMHTDWVRSIRDWCIAAGVPFMFKQWGEWLHESQDNGTISYGGSPMFVWPDGTKSYRVGKKRAGWLLDGCEWNEYPVGVKKE